MNLEEKLRRTEAQVQAQAVQIHSIWSDMDAQRRKLDRIRQIAENPDPYDRDGEADALRKILDVLDE